MQYNYSSIFMLTQTLCNLFSQNVLTCGLNDDIEENFRKPSVFSYFIYTQKYQVPKEFGEQI